MHHQEPYQSDCASVWFLRLERARNLNDFEAAAEAVRELKRLGVMVRFVTPPRPLVEYREVARHA